MKRVPILPSVAILLLLVGAAAVQRTGAPVAHARASTRTVPRAAGVPYTAADLVGEWDSAGCASAHEIGAHTPDAFFRRFYLFSETSFNVRYSY